MELIEDLMLYMFKKIFNNWNNAPSSCLMTRKSVSKNQSIVTFLVW
jgi:hypothetical protein